MHRTVLSGEAMDLMNIKEGDFVVDATLGAGGHTIELLKRVGLQGRVVAIDVDQNALIQASKRIKQEIPQLLDRAELVNDNFANLSEILKKTDLGKKPSAILADLGWRIEQIEKREYGMSFQQDFPLDMRLSKKIGKITAKDIVNSWSEEKLADLFWVYADERDSYKIAEKIVHSRGRKPIESTKELAEIVADAKGSFKTRVHPATKVFQALRIIVNEEMRSLEIFIKEAIDSLKPEGRLAIISFHSLEDKKVKDTFRTNARGCVCSKYKPICNCGLEQKVKIITKKPVRSSLQEQKENPRSRSARLRVVEKIKRQHR